MPPPPTRCANSRARSRREPRRSRAPVRWSAAASRRVAGGGATRSSVGYAHASRRERAAPASRRTDHTVGANAVESPLEGIRPIATPSSTAAGAGSLPRPRSRIDPSAGQIRRQQKTRRKAHASVRSFLEPGRRRRRRSSRRRSASDERRPEQPPTGPSGQQCRGGEHQSSRRRSGSPACAAAGSRVSANAADRARSAIRPEPQTEQPEQRAGRDVDEVMLIRGEHRNADQREPGCSGHSAQRGRCRA